VTEILLAQWACAKKFGLPVYKIGGSARYRRDDIDRWLKSRVVGV
jgi:hypothetical protein